MVLPFGPGICIYRFRSCSLPLRYSLTVLSLIHLLYFHCFTYCSLPLSTDSLTVLSLIHLLFASTFHTDSLTVRFHFPHWFTYCSLPLSTDSLTVRFHFPHWFTYCSLPFNWFTYCSLSLHWFTVQVSLFSAPSHTCQPVVNGILSRTKLTKSLVEFSWFRQHCEIPNPREFKNVFKDMNKARIQLHIRSWSTLVSHLALIL
jgi:hypothetical protein